MKPPTAAAELLPSLPPGAGIALLRLRSLGDTLLMTPAAAALRAWRPDLRLAALVEPRFAGVLAGNPDFATVILVPDGPAGRCRALAALRAFRPALAVGLHGGSTAAGLAFASGAPHRATFDGLRHRWAYNVFTPPAAPAPGRSRLHTVEHVASLFHALGLPPSPLGPLRVFPQAATVAGMRRRLEARGITGAYAFLVPEAREAGMRWPAERFAELAAWLRRERGLASVCASPGAGEPIEGVALFAATRVEELIALEAGAAIYIGSDGGALHIAAALGKPIVGLYSSTDLEVWAPWQARARLLRHVPLAALPLDSVTAAVADALAPAPPARETPQAALD